jgi:hypothetical protein
MWRHHLQAMICTPWKLAMPLVTPSNDFIMLPRDSQKMTFVKSGDGGTA